MNELSKNAQEAIRWLFSNEALKFGVMEARIEIAKRFGVDVAKELQEWTIHPCKSDEFASRQNSLKKTTQEQIGETLSGTVGKTMPYKKLIR